MAELYQMYADKQAQIENVVKGLLASGMISMEEADHLESLVPGEIHNLDPNIIFDLDSSTHGSKLALEAAMAGLDKIKMAFIVAVIAFILRYIASLHNSTGYSFSGGSGSGWGGSAPSKFDSNSPPGTEQFSRDVAAHQELLIDDFKVNYDNFKEQFDQAKPWLANLGKVEGTKLEKTLKHLVDVTIKDILVRNSITKEDGKTYYFDDGAASLTMADFAKGEGLKGSNIKNLAKVLDKLTDYYTPRAVFSLNSFVDKVVIPPFVLNAELTKPAIDFITQTTNPVKNIQKIESEFENFLSKVKATGNNGWLPNDIIPWLTQHFVVENTSAVDKSNSPKLGDVLTSICAINVPGLEVFNPEHSVQVFDAYILNTGSMGNRIKQMIKALTSNDINTARNEVTPNKHALDKLTREYFEAITSGDPDKANSVIGLDKFITILESFNELLASGYKDFEKLQGLTQEFIEATAKAREAAASVDDSNTAGESTDKLAKNVRICLDTSYNAVVAISSCFAGAATMGSQLKKFDAAKVNHIIGKLNEMNKHYFDLTQDLIRINGSLVQ